MTVAELIESENGTETISAMDTLVSNITDYAANPSATVADFYFAIDKFRGRLRELGSSITDTALVPPSE